jgi:hypothetical protein
MKFLIQLLLTIITSWLLQSFLPWWSAVIAAFIIGLLLSGNKGISSFFAGFSAIFLLWFGYALVIDINSQSILTEKIASILTVNNKYILIMITGVIGALPAGFGALTGNRLARLLKKEKNTEHYS